MRGPPLRAATSVYSTTWHSWRARRASSSGRRKSTVSRGKGRGGMVAVSVLIPAFNAEVTLAAALRSVERQTERDWECLIVDDGSTDGTLRVARLFAGRDARFRVVSRQHDGI